MRFVPQILFSNFLGSSNSFITLTNSSLSFQFSLKPQYTTPPFVTLLSLSLGDPPTLRLRSEIKMTYPCSNPTGINCTLPSSSSHASAGHFPIQDLAGTELSVVQSVGLLFPSPALNAKLKLLSSTIVKKKWKYFKRHGNSLGMASYIPHCIS